MLFRNLTEIMQIFENRAREFKNLTADEVFMFDEKDYKEIERYANHRGFFGIGKKKQLNFNVCTTNGYTPLYSADLNKIKLFVENGADVNHVDAFGENALFHHQYSYEISEYLLQKGINVNQVNKKGDNIGSHIYIHNENSLKLIELYQRYGFDIKTIKKENITSTFRDEIAIGLIKLGLDPNTQNETGKTFLFYTDKPEYVKQLIELGADVNHKDHNDRTALFGAGEDKIEILCHSGIDVNAVDNWGHTAIEYTLFDGQYNMLIRNNAYDQIVEENEYKLFRNKNHLLAALRTIRFERGQVLITHYNHLTQKNFVDLVPKRVSK